MPSALVLQDVELDRGVTSVRVADGVVAAIARDVAVAPGDDVIEGHGGALLHGLHDHHVHVHALAAAMDSIEAGPPSITTPDDLARALRAAARTGSVRAVGYHERVAGSLDRSTLDAIVADVPVRVQHRSGGLWVLNTAALRAANLLDRPDNRPDDRPDDRVERDRDGIATGRLWRGDDLVRVLGAPVDLARVGAALARYGVTAITDATATNDASAVTRLAALRQRLRVMGPLDLALPPTVDPARVVLGEVKILLDDDRLPAFDDSVALVGAAHERGRGAAFHCVTLVQLQFALAVLRATGVRGDRIEHASIAPPESIRALHELGLTVATQPSFVAERGDDYLRDVDARDVDALYPVGSLCRAGIATLGSTDAPYTTSDPWRAMRAAVDRRTPSGTVLGASERITPAAALSLFGADRPIVAGVPADLVLLHAPRAEVLQRLDARDVAATIIAGEVAHTSG